MIKYFVLWTAVLKYRESVICNKKWQ